MIQSNVFFLPWGYWGPGKWSNSSQPCLNWWSSFPHFPCNSTQLHPENDSKRPKRRALSPVPWWPHDKMHDAGDAGGGGNSTIYTFGQNASTPLNKVIYYSIHWDIGRATAICLWPFSFSYWIHFTSKINQHLGNLGWVLFTVKGIASPIALQPWSSATKDPISLLLPPSLSISLSLSHTHTHTHTR